MTAEDKAFYKTVYPEIIERTWIFFGKVVPVLSKKTNVYIIRSQEGTLLLGSIKWYGPWRKYCFFPQPDCVFESKCIDDINDFLKQLMVDRKKN